MFLFQGAWRLGGVLEEVSDTFQGFKNQCLEAASLEHGIELLVTPNPWQCSERGTRVHKCRI